MAPSVVVAGGGTAGHIEPALAVGEVLRDAHNANVVALGTERGLETSIVPARGFELRLIDPVPIPRSKPWLLAGVPFKLNKSVSQTRRILKDTGAQAVFGTGGYVAAPAYLAARSLGIPFYVLETNALAGMANKLGVRLGGTGFNAVANSGMPGDVVGIPVRPGVGVDPDGAKAERGLKMWNLDPDRKTLLVTGGSQGARSINNAVVDAAKTLQDAGIGVLHAYGKKNEVELPTAVKEGTPPYVAVPYIERMDLALAAADAILCRSGAMTVAEVSAVGLPGIYVPLPHGNGEQELNVRPITHAGGGVIIKDAELTGHRVSQEVIPLLRDETRWHAASLATLAAGHRDAAEKIAEKIIAAAEA